MVFLSFSRKENTEEESLLVEHTYDGSVDRYGNPAIRNKTGRWGMGFLVLVNQGLATMAFFGVGVNLVLFLTRVIGQDNAEAANNVSTWLGTVYLFSLVGAYLSDSYWGRFKTCAIFQAIFILPKGCGDEQTPCDSHSSLHVSLFYVSLYMVALGNGGYQPNIATFGADQFDEEHPQESVSKISFFSYFYLSFNLGSLLSNTILAYYEDKGKWTLGFSASTGAAIMALLLYFKATPYYRHFKQQDDPFARFFEVFGVAIKKRKAHVPLEVDELYEEDAEAYFDTRCRMISHTHGFKFLDKAAVITSYDGSQDKLLDNQNEKRLCTVTQVEEVKCILRLLPIWLCTIMYSVVYTQMASLFVVQGAEMKTTIGSIHIPPATMSSFDVLSVAACIYFHSHVLNPLVIKLRKKGLTELERMGMGLIFGILSMIVAGIVEIYRLKYATENCTDCDSRYASSLNILWQIPQFVLVGASEVYMFVPQLEFYNGQAPEGLRSFGSALYTLSMSLGNYASIMIVNIVMKMTTRDNMPGWIPQELNNGHLEQFYFLLAFLTTVDFGVFLYYAKAYKYVEWSVKDCKDINYV
ncbi:Protein NRT1/ PTR FAMILY 7.3 [Bienertia sinuspersici]